MMRSIITGYNNSNQLIVDTVDVILLLKYFSEIYYVIVRMMNYLRT